MKTSFYFPAPVEVVKVTNENLAEVAEWCGGKVASTESRRVPGRQDSYVWVPTPKGNSVSWAFPGMFITKRMVVTIKDEMKATYAVFRKDYFNRNYFDTPTEAVDKTWEKFEKNKQKANGNNVPTPAAPKPRATYKTKAEIEHDKQVIATEPFRETVDETGAEQPAHGVVTKDLMRYAHPHNHSEECGDCINVNELPGVHIFNDTRIIRGNTNEKEHDMERSKHGYPVLSEEESADRKSLQEAVDVVQTVIPGSELIGDDFAGGQALEGGEIVEIEPIEIEAGFGGSLDDGTSEYAETAGKNVLAENHEASQES